MDEPGVSQIDKSCSVHTAAGFNVDDIPSIDSLLLQAVIDGRIKLQLLDASHCFQPNDNMADDLAIAACLSTSNL